MLFNLLTGYGVGLVTAEDVEMSVVEYFMCTLRLAWYSINKPFCIGSCEYTFFMVYWCVVVIRTIDVIVISVPAVIPFNVYDLTATKTCGGVIA